MKKIILVLSIVFAAILSHAQKEKNLFVAAEVAETAGASLVYNKLLGLANIGLGVGIEVIGFDNMKEKGTSVLGDVRYYIRQERSDIIPFGQIGYNITTHKYVITDAMGNTSEARRNGGLHIAVGLGYSYNLLANGMGVFGALKFRTIDYNIKSNGQQISSENKSRLVLSVGLRL